MLQRTDLFPSWLASTVMPSNATHEMLREITDNIVFASVLLIGIDVLFILANLVGFHILEVLVREFWQHYVGPSLVDF